MKQYLVLCDEAGAKLVESTFQNGLFKFLEVQGMPAQGNVNVLVTPVVPPITPMPPIEAVTPPVTDEVKY